MFCCWLFFEVFRKQFDVIQKPQACKKVSIGQKNASIHTRLNNKKYLQWKKICVFVQAWCDDEGERYCCRKCHASKYKQSILNSQRRTRNSLNSGSLKTRVNIIKTNKSIAVKVRISFPSRRLLLKICCTYAGIVYVRRPSYLDSLAQRKRRKIMEREHGSKRTKNSFSRR